MRLTWRSCIAALLATTGLMAGSLAGSASADMPKSEKQSQGEPRKSDRGTIADAELFIQQNWQREYGGIWSKGRGQKPKIHFVGFTDDPASKVEVLRKEFPLQTGRYKPVEVERSLDDLLKVMNRVNRFMRKRAPDVTDGSLSLELARNAIGIEFLEPAPKIRRALKKRFGDGIVVTRAV